MYTNGTKSILLYCKLLIVLQFCINQNLDYKYPNHHALIQLRQDAYRYISVS